MLQRIITSIIGITALVCIIYILPKIYFFFLTLLSVIISLFEFYNIIDKKKYSLKFFFSCFTAIIFLLSFYSNNESLLIKVLILFILSVFCSQIFNFKNFHKHFKDTIIFTIGNIYISFFLGFSIFIYNLPHGNNLIMLLLLIAWATDSFAYLTGIKIGKHKLYPLLSPNKTIEGACGGIVGALIAGILFNLFVLKFSFWKILIITFITSIFSILGDLFESMIKRLNGVKDSGNIIPGHGGMLDRIDSLFFAVPIFYILIKI